ncbi:MAG TPA: amidohydrolase family protein [Geminicoccaceae bacterium]|nr:amidohydrolase family protein [Geminicoccaceae bacterium]
MAATLLTNVMVFDATGADPFPGEVLIEGNRVRKVATGRGQIARESAGRVVDGHGMTLMPGMTEGHCHISFTGVAQPFELGNIPPEEHTLLTAKNAKLLFDCGFTSVYCAASAKPRLDVVVRNAVEAGDLVGPRIRAASPEIVATGGLGDERRLHIHRESFALIADGPEEIRKTVRTCIREGVDNLKLNVSGDDFYPHAPGGVTTYMDDEVKMACEIAHEFGKQVATHSRSSNSVKLSVRNGVDCVYHCEFADEDALDMMEAAKDRIFVGPAVGLLHNTVYEAAPWGLTPEVVERMGMIRNLEKTCEVYREVKKRGIRAVIGGDYGFAWTPQGTNARDLLHFVNLFGYTPKEALLLATRNGGELMRKGHELGQIREGYLADLLLVDGDPLRDLSILVGPERLAMIMKDGRMHKDPADYDRAERIAAE